MNSLQGEGLGREGAYSLAASSRNQVVANMPQSSEWSNRLRGGRLTYPIITNKILKDITHRYVRIGKSNEDFASRLLCRFSMN